MRVFNRDAFNWNHRIAPEGNMGRVSPVLVAQWCDTFQVPWYSDGETYSSGILVYCYRRELWQKILASSKLKEAM